jgi:predicted dehydrogenase
VAIVGAGNMAREHARAFADVPGVTLAGIHSRTRSRAESLAEEFGIAGVYDSVSELYEGTRADLVVVTVFEMAMNSVSKTCFGFPWKVLLEKPPGYCLEDALDIRAAAVASTCAVFVGLNRRFLSSTRAALSDLAPCSSPRFVHVQDQQSLEQATSLGHPDLVVANWMYANSIHVIDYLRVFARGEVKSVRPIFPWRPENPGVVMASVELDSGDRGLYEGIWDGPGHWAVTVTTPKKRWELRPLEQGAYQVRGERRLQAVEACAWDRDFKPGFRLQAEEAASAARGQPSRLASLDDAIETMRLIRAVFHS